VSSSPLLPCLVILLFADFCFFRANNSCQSGDQGWWQRIVQLKMAILQLWRNGGVGHKIASVKAIQRIIQTQTNSGATSDPRVSLRLVSSANDRADCSLGNLQLARSQEPNLSLCRPNHPFLKIALLEEEASKLLEESITSLFTTTNADLVSALTTSLTALIKVRNQFTKLVVTALTNWAPNALSGSGYPQIKSVEKVIKLSLSHLLK